MKYKIKKKKYFTGGTFDPSILSSFTNLMGKGGTKNGKADFSGFKSKDLTSLLAQLYSQKESNKSKQNNTSYSKFDSSADSVNTIGQSVGKFTPTGGKISAGGQILGTVLQDIGGSNTIGKDVDGNELTVSKNAGLDAVGSGVKLGAAGAEIGSTLGPIGTAIGTGVGFTAGVVGSLFGRKKKKKELKTKAKFGSLKRSFLNEHKVNTEMYKNKLITQNNRIPKFGIN